MPISNEIAKGMNIIPIPKAEYKTWQSNPNNAILVIFNAILLTCSYVIILFFYLSDNKLRTR